MANLIQELITTWQRHVDSLEEEMYKMLEMLESFFVMEDVGMASVTRQGGLEESKYLVVEDAFRV